MKTRLTMWPRKINLATVRPGEVSAERIAKTQTSPSKMLSVQDRDLGPGRGAPLSKEFQAARETQMLRATEVTLLCDI